MQESLGYLQAGNVTVDGIKQILSDCNLCDKAYSTETFDLAGPGIYLSFAIQAVLSLIFGTFSSFISYITPPHASPSTRLTIARLQILFETVLSTNIFIYLATMVTSFVRLKQGPTAFECLMINQLLDLQAMVIVLSLIARVVQQQPAKIIPSAPRWHMGQVWFIANVIPLLGHYVKSASSSSTYAVISRICALTRALDKPSGSMVYPKVRTTESGNSHLLWMFGAFVVSIGVCVMFDEVRNRFLVWLKKVFTSRMTLVIAIALWALLTLLALAGNSVEMVFLRRRLSAAGVANTDWDFGQVVAVGIWFPALYQLLLTVLVSLNGKPVYNAENFSWTKAFYNIGVYLIEELCK